ncbi:MAG: hypothetical protein ACOCUH_00220 [Bacteriovoracia bacterium]
MKNLVAVSRCLGVVSEKIGEDGTCKYYRFHFKGWLKGIYISEIRVFPYNKYIFMAHGDYILYIVIIKVVDSILYGNVLKIKAI